MSFVNSIVTTQGLRHQNRAIVLNSIRENGPLAHTAIAQKTGLASGTVSVITAEFLHEGVLEKVEHSSGKGRGRPRILFAMRPGFANIAVVRILADRIEYSLVDYQSTLLDRQTIVRDPTQTDAVEFGNALTGQLLEFVARSKILPAEIKAISVTTNGEVDESSRTLVWSTILGDQKVDFRALLAADWGATVSLTSEICFSAHNVMQQAIREKAFVAGARQAVLSLSDSIGLGVATINEQGEIDLASPSFGHMPHEAGGPVCRCGALGCLESYAGFYGILRAAFDAPKDIIPAKFIPFEQMQRIANAARSGDRMAGFAFRQAGMALGMCLSRMFNVLGPMPLTIIGSGLEFYDLFREGLESQLSDSFLVRKGNMPEVSLLPNQSERAFASNAFVALRRFDHTQVAPRRLSK